MKEHVYQWDNVVIGYSLSAFIYAFYTGAPVIGYGGSMPKIFDDFKSEVDYSAHGFGKGKTTNQVELWNHLYMLLSMGGQIPFADNVQTLRRGEENTLVVTTSNRSRVSRVKYKELWVFDDYGVEGMPPIVEANEVYRVVDWFNVHSGMKHKETFIITPSRDFIREIVFYPSERLDGEHLDMKDLCAISWLDEEQLQLFETSPTYAKFVILKEMKSMGIRGTKNGICPRTGNQKHYALKIEFDRREKEMIAMHGYAPEPSISFHRVSPPELLSELKHEGWNAPANPYIPKVLLNS